MSEENSMPTKFVDFNLHPDLQEGISSMGFVDATAIQAEAIPVIKEGKDIIGCAQTGTGKTGAFLIPTMHRICDQGLLGKTVALILAPTRELALQIDAQIEGLSYFTGAQSITVYGGGSGVDFGQEKTALTSGVEIIVATPGKFISHLNLGYVNLDDIKFFILDEADRMLDMGFYDDIMKVFKALPKEKQTLLFSATMPKKIRDLAHKILVEPAQISIAISKTAEGIDQKAVLCYDKQKEGVIQDIFERDQPESVIIFCSTKSQVKDTVRNLKRNGYDVEAFHSDLDQKQREEVLLGFKNKRIRTLVATDILSRGIDIEDISMVINYRVPQDAEDYVHRVGRTARASSTGQAYTFINEEDQGRFARIEDLIEKEIEKLQPPSDLGAGPAYNPGKSKGGGHRNGSGGKKYKGKRPNHKFKNKGGNKGQGGGQRHSQPKGNNKSGSPQS